MPAGLRESQKLETAIWTPSTKAEAGEHDENISKERAGEILGEEVAGRVERMSLRLYEMVGRESSAGEGFVSAVLIVDIGPRLRREARDPHRRHEIRVRA